VADLQACPDGGMGRFFCFSRRRITSLKAGHYKIEQQEYAPSPVLVPGVATGLKTLALFDVGEWNFEGGT